MGIVQVPYATLTLKYFRALMSMHMSMHMSIHMSIHRYDPPQLLTSEPPCLASNSETVLTLFGDGLIATEAPLVSLVSLDSTTPYEEVYSAEFDEKTCGIRCTIAAVGAEFEGRFEVCIDADMSVFMCVEMCIDMCIDMCTDMCRDITHVYAHVCRHVYRKADMSIGTM